MPQFALLLTTLIWGATFPATKAALEQIPPLSFLFLRFLLGAALVLVIVLIVRRGLGHSREILRMSLIATVWLFLGYVLQTEGLRYTTASNSAFITVLYVVFVPLFLKRFQIRIWLCAGLALVGLWLLVDPRVSMNVGDVMTLACAAAFAAHIACLEQYSRQGDATSLFVWQMLFVAVGLFPAMALMESPTGSAFAPTPTLLMALTVTGIFATGAFAVQMWAQQLLPAHRVALIFSLEPVIAAWFSWYFLDEHLDARGWLGSACILAAVLMGSVSKNMVNVETQVKTSPAV